jgi:hypothetical protein
MVIGLQNARRFSPEPKVHPDAQAGGAGGYTQHFTIVTSIFKE